MVSGSLALLYLPWFSWGKQGGGPDRGQRLVEWGDFLSVLLFLGSGPDRGQSLVEWGDFLSVLLFFCPSICPSIHPFPPLGHQTRHEAQI